MKRIRSLDADYADDADGRGDSFLNTKGTKVTKDKPLSLVFLRLSA